MKKLVTYTGGHPLRLDDINLLQDANIEGTKAMLDGLCYGYTTTGVYLSGVAITPSGPTFQCTAGYAYYSGEIYPIDAQIFPTPGVGETYWWQITEEVLLPAPATYQDLTTHNVRIRRKLMAVVAPTVPVDSFALTSVLRLEQIIGSPKNSIIPYWGSTSHFNVNGDGVFGTPAYGYALCDGGITSLITGGSFTRPNFKGRTLVGFDSTQSEFNSVDGSNRPNETGGAKTHTLTKAEIPTHVHTYLDSYVNITTGSSAGIAVNGGGANTLLNNDQTRTSFDGTPDGLAGNAHNNLQPYHTILWMIKLY